MEITEVRITLMPVRTDKLRAFCCITLDNSFVIRDLKIIEGPRGIFVAMPSRKIMGKCPRCSAKNALRARYCNGCGSPAVQDRAPAVAEAKPRFHADICHPINAESRDVLQRRILAAYSDEIMRSRQPGYKPVDMGYPPEEFDLEDVPSTTA